MTDQDQIRQLETENTRLRAMLARAGVTILPEPDLPNSEELDRLLKMVERAEPRLKCPEGSKEVIAINREQFANAIHFLCFVYRVDKPNNSYAASVWVDGCREWLRSQAIHPSEMSLRPFVAAALASGIVYEPLSEYPFGVNLGISLGSATRPSTAWRDVVLRNGIPSPVEPKYRRPVTTHNWT